MALAAPLRPIEDVIAWLDRAEIDPNDPNSFVAGLAAGSSIMGSGADEYLIDDPYGSMQDARSEVVRDGVWEWFNGTVYNRLQPGGAIILINHRMHEDDIAGRLIERMKAGADNWTVVRLTAIAEAPDDLYPDPDPLGRKPGEALWPSAYPVAALDRIRANTLPRYWSALYQQRPTPDEGEMFVPDRMTPSALMRRPRSPRAVFVFLMVKPRSSRAWVSFRWVPTNSPATVAHLLHDAKRSADASHAFGSRSHSSAIQAATASSASR